MLAGRRTQRWKAQRKRRKKEQTEKRMRKTKERKESEGGMGSPIEGTGKGKGTIDQKTRTSNRQLGRINRTEPSTGPGRIRWNLRKKYRKAVLLGWLI